MEPALQADNIIKRYGTFLALKGVSLSVGRGEIFGVIGPNGAGKTTFLEILSGIRRPTSGRVSLLGEAPAGNRALQARIGVQIQDISFFPELSVRDIMRSYAVLYGVTTDIAGLAEQFGLSGKLATRYRNLSGGQKQRVSVALAFINNPDVLFLDEPTVGLDPVSRRGVWALIRQQRDAGRTVLITSHYMEEMEALCDRVAFLRDGSVVECGTVAEITEKYTRREVVEVRFKGLSNQSLLQDAFPEARVVPQGDRFHIYSDAPQQMLERLAAVERSSGCNLAALRVEQDRLDDIYMQIFEEAEHD